MELTVGRKHNNKIPVTISCDAFETNLTIDESQLANTYESVKDSLIELSNHRNIPMYSLVSDILENCTTTETEEVINYLKNAWGIE